VLVAALTLVACEPTVDVIARGSPKPGTPDGAAVNIKPPELSPNNECFTENPVIVLADDEGLLYAFDPHVAAPPKRLGRPDCPAVLGPPLAIALDRNGTLWVIDANYTLSSIYLQNMSCKAQVGKVAPAKDVGLTFAGDTAGGEIAYSYGTGLSQGKSPMDEMIPLGPLPLSVRGLIGTPDGRLFARIQADSMALGLAQVKAGKDFATIGAKFEIPIGMKETIDEQGVAYSGGNFFVFGSTIRRVTLGDEAVDVVAWPDAPARTVASSSSCNSK
jgi:hypothetical protein